MKVDGERLYKRAHRGESVETPEREVEVYRAELVAEGDGRATFEIECSSGTYVRTLIETLGDAYCEQLRRTAVGPLRLADASDTPISANEALVFLPERELDAEEAVSIAQRPPDRRRWRARRPAPPHPRGAPARGRPPRRPGDPPGGRPRAGRDSRAGASDAPTLITSPPMSLKVTSLPDAEPRERHVAIGTFDGVHLGHQAVIDDADTVLTFEPHPVRVIHPEAAPKLIMPFAIKRDVIEGLGVEELVVIPFDREFAAIEAERLPRRDPGRAARREDGLGRRELPLRQEGARATRRLLAEQDAFETRVVPLVERTARRSPRPGSAPWSPPGRWRTHATSSARPFMVEGTVVEGDKRGRTLGFPTANLVPDDELVSPGHGVYAAFANGTPAAVNVGVRPMFETGRGLLIEAYLIDFEGDLYGDTLRVAFVERLRGEKRFPSVEDLIAQMHRDVAEARELCANFTA